MATLNAKERQKDTFGKKYAKQMNHYFVIFKRFPNGSQELFKWVFPKKK